MISGEHAYIRTTEPDDAIALHRFYDVERPRAALLDNKQEPLLPTRSELAELLSRKEAKEGHFFTVEDRVGEVSGFCSLRSMHQEALFGDISLLFLDDATYGTPLADEAFAFIACRSFEKQRLRKLMVQCLDGETVLRGFFERHGFTHEGTRREVLHARGRWHNLDTLALFAREYAAGKGS